MKQKTDYHQIMKTVRYNVQSCAAKSSHENPVETDDYAGDDCAAQDCILKFSQQVSLISANEFFS